MVDNIQIITSNDILWKLIDVSYILTLEKKIIYFEQLKKFMSRKVMLEPL